MVYNAEASLDSKVILQLENQTICLLSSIYYDHDRMPLIIKNLICKNQSQPDGSVCVII